MSTRTNHACEGKEEGGVGGGTVSRGRGGGREKGLQLSALKGQQRLWCKRAKSWGGQYGWKSELLSKK